MNTFLKMFRWLGGAFFALTSMGMFGTFRIGPASVVLLATLIVMPPTGGWLGRRFSPVARHWPALGVGFVLFLVGMIWAASSDSSDFKHQSSKVTTATAPASPPTAADAPKIPQAVLAPAAPHPPTQVEMSAKVGPNAAFLIQGKGWDKTRRVWGDSWIKRINRAMPLVAQKAAESPECDYVEIVGLSDRSTPKKTIVFFVDCRNGARFYLREDEISIGAIPVSKNSKTAAISDSAAVTACEDSVKSQLAFPLTFARHWTATSVYRAPYGNIAVEFVFEAKNGFGAELPQRARCVIDDTGIHPAELSVQ